MRAMMIWSMAAAAMIGPWGCASDKLRYLPDPPIGGLSDLSADYTMLDDKLLVEVNTEGYRIDQVWIATPAGAQVKPAQIEYETGRRGGVGFGVGVGVGSDGSGVGVGTGTDVGGSGYITGNTKLYFDNAVIGPPPWRLHIKLIGMPRTDIVLEARSE